METDELIRQLARDVKPVPSRAVELRLASGIAAGAAIALVALYFALGLRADFAAALASFAFWMKAGYTASIAAIAIIIASHLARPDSRPKRWYFLLIAPVLLLAAIAGAEVMRSEPGDWPSLLLGGSAGQCSARILAFSIPVFAGLAWAYRSFAPTRLAAAGAAAGLAAGAIAAALYVLYCREVSACFVLAWYTLGISLPALLGALLGPALFRW